MPAENQMEARSWLVYVLTTMPNEFAMPPEGGMPERLEPISRIPTRPISWGTAASRKKLLAASGTRAR
jgi:hypothetical protein